MLYSRRVVGGKHPSPFTVPFLQRLLHAIPCYVYSEFLALSASRVVTRDGLFCFLIVCKSSFVSLPDRPGVGVGWDRVGGWMGGWVVVVVVGGG